MPGIEAREPDRTETRSGRFSSPKRAETVSPIAASACITSLRKASGNLFPAAKNASQTSVVIVKSGGNGKP